MAWTRSVIIENHRTSRQIGGEDPSTEFVDGPIGELTHRLIASCFFIDRQHSDVTRKVCRSQDWRTIF